MQSLIVVFARVIKTYLGNGIPRGCEMPFFDMYYSLLVGVVCLSLIFRGLGGFVFTLQNASWFTLSTLWLQLKPC